MQNQTAIDDSSFCLRVPATASFVHQDRWPGQKQLSLALQPPHASILRVASVYTDSRQGFRTATDVELPLFSKGNKVLRRLAAQWVVGFSDYSDIVAQRVILSRQQGRDRSTVSVPTTSSQFPYDRVAGRPDTTRPREYNAAASAQVVFSDLSGLTGVGSGLAALPDVTIQRTEWCLTDATLDKISREARIGAVRDAIEKANDYATVVGKAVFPVQLMSVYFRP